MLGGGERGGRRRSKRGNRQDTRGREFVFVSVGPPGGDCWMVEVNESDWPVGVFLLVLRFVHSHGFTFILPSLAVSQCDMKGSGADKKCFILLRCRDQL